MKCPKCTSEMAEGEVVIKGSVLGFLLIGLSWMRLLFTGSDKRSVVVLKPWIRKSSLLCLSCKTVIIYPDTVKAEEESRSPDQW